MTPALFVSIRQIEKIVTRIVIVLDFLIKIEFRASNDITLIIKNNPIPRGQPNLSIGIFWSLNSVSLVSSFFKALSIISELREPVSSLKKIPLAASAIAFSDSISNFDLTRLPPSSLIKLCWFPRDLSSGIIDPFSDPTPIVTIIVPFSFAFFASFSASPSKFSPSVNRISAWLSVLLSIKVSVACLIASAKLVPPLATAYVSSWSIDSFRAFLSWVTGTMMEALPEKAINPIKSSGNASIRS